MANANRGLGKGLGALLGDAALRTDTSDNLYLPISQIEPYANQPRRHFDEEALQDLADSIREHGIIQPVDGPPPFFRLLSDHRGRAPLARRAHRRSCRSARHRHRGG